MNKDVLKDITGYAAARRIRLTSPARRRVSELGVTYDDLRYGLMQVSSCTPGPGDAREIAMRQRSGEPLDVIVLFQDGLVIVDVR